MEWIEYLGEFVHLLADYLINPSSRLCLIYFIPVGLLAYIQLGQQICPSDLSELGQRWISRSALQDYGLIALNALLKVTLFSHIVTWGVDLARWTYHILYDFYGLVSFDFSPLFVIIAYTLIYTMLDDLSVYLLHRLMHRSSLLWSIHAIHHSAEQLTPFTWLRIHPVEVLLNTLRRVLTYGFVTGVAIYLSGGAVSVITLLGVNIFSLLFFVMGANLRHSHIPISYGNRLEYLFISPLQHQLHHSSDPRHIGRNFGSKFAIWDLCFGTLMIGKEIDRPLRFGMTR